MQTSQSDQEIVAIVAEKIGIAPNSGKYDDNGKLINLELSGLALSQLPPELWQLTSLQELYLDENQLSQIPAEIGQLTNLQKLRLDKNQLSRLPPELWRLTNLQRLDLDNNQLSQVPAEIGQLNSLQVLSLSYNQLSQLPPELWQLSGLQELSLSYNQLSQLPAEIGQLTSLQKLWLSNNQLSQLPAEIGQLSGLQELYLHENQLSQLPAEIGQLTSLQTLKLDGNFNLLTPPPEIIARSTEDILSFLRELQISSIDRYEAKLLIVGEGGTGKSSLLRALRNDSFDPHLSTTHGIEVDKLKLSHPDHDLILNTWDFGGQQIYHATHQFFLTKRSLYIVVWNARLGAEQGRRAERCFASLSMTGPTLNIKTHNRGPTTPIHMPYYFVTPHQPSCIPVMRRICDARSF
jgi:internalin A